VLATTEAACYNPRGRAVRACACLSLPPATQNRYSLSPTDLSSCRRFTL
jgi:hypothetical protein